MSVREERDTRERIPSKIDSVWMLLESSAIRAVRYFPDERRLRMRFTNGGVYDYYDVPPMVYEGLVHPSGGSHGRYYGEHIRDHYDHDQVVTALR